MGWPTEEAVRRGGTALYEADSALFLGADGGDGEAQDELARRVLAAAGLPELVGFNDAAAILDVLPTSLDKVTDLPEPAYRLSTGRLWLADEIRALAATRPKKRAAA